jgi:protein SCO1/2
MNQLSRRHFVSGALAVGATAGAAVGQAHAGALTPPQAPPNLSLTLDDQSVTTLSAVLAGHVTALQLMFTSCQATCPIQGALFGEAVKKLGSRSPKVQLLSVSIDPEHDTPAALHAWLQRFGGSTSRWRAASPDKALLDGLVKFLKSQKSGPDPHTAQAYYFNLKGELFLRSVDFPPAADIVRVLETAAKNG